MASAAASAFTYTPLDPGYIRLLRVLPESTTDDIRCQLIRHKIESGVRQNFGAVSYCWHDPTPVASITIDGQPFGVAQNLLDFLQNRFVKPVPFGMYNAGAFWTWDLWIDAICINQADLEEKTEQLNSMHHIYCTAKGVIAWLGKEEPFTKAAFLALHMRWAMNNGFLTPDQTLDLEQKAAALGRDDVVALSRNPYFSRTWIVPEVICSDTRLMLHSGRFVVPFSSLRAFSALDKGTIATQGAPDALVKDGLSIAVESLLYTKDRNKRAMASAPGGNRQTGDPLHTFVTTVLDHKSKQCSDPRDKIFAFRGLPTAQALDEQYAPRFEADYTMSFDEVAVATLSYIDRLSGVDESELAGAVVPEFVVMSLFGVDLASDGFRAWLRGKVVHDATEGTLKMLTGSGKSVDCTTPIINSLLNGEVSEIVTMLTGRTSNPSNREGRLYVEEKPRDPNRYTSFPNILIAGTEFRSRLHHIEEDVKGPHPSQEKAYTTESSPSAAASKHSSTDEEASRVISQQKQKRNKLITKLSTIFKRHRESNP
ncbi:uncharacterized protein AB675_6945 [Cyphellophora attinorum]|uniref:Heterokaryon incompatibility domain-containing protein n=1 Tax=Cyphellophora attinorum TaxID=1664694 RepID=A0A0N1P237_9EURO|nr:uncharacterized protein AB675_6945 [Phialophora attinorum]KPI43223.1 hypothetical protein AB675_6945 [Phialophora attinorum]